MDWIVRKQKPSSLFSFSAVPSTRYMTIGSPEDGYLSILNTTERDTVSIIGYQCKATLVVGTNIIQKKKNETTVKVVGML